MKGYKGAVIHCEGLDLKSDRLSWARRRPDGETMAAGVENCYYHCGEWIH